MHPYTFLKKIYTPYAWQLCIMLCASILESGHKILQTYAVKLLIDFISNNICFNYGSLFCIFLCVQVALCLIFLWGVHAEAIVVSGIQKSCIDMIFNQLSQMQLSFFNMYASGGIQTKMRDISRLSSRLIFDFMMNFLQFTIELLSTLYMLYKIHYLFVYGLLLWVIMSALLARYTKKYITIYSKNMSSSEASTMDYVSDYLSNIQTVKLYNAEAYEYHRFQLHTNNFSQHAQKRTLFYGQLSALITFSKSIYLIYCIMLLFYLKKYQTVTSGDFALIISIHLRMLGRIGYIISTWSDFVSNYVVIKQALQFFYSNTIATRNISIDKPGDIDFRQVSFSYNHKRILENISFTIKQGQKIGIIGASGSGKSTLINCLMRLHTITSGHISINNHDIQYLADVSFHNLFAVVSQDTRLFNRTVKENICYETYDHDKMLDASKKAQAHSFIMNLPLQYDTCVGNEGSLLSGGQRQRICIARAFYKDAPIIIFDEATAHLDAKTEAAIQRSILTSSKTVLVATHRTSTLIQFDRVLILGSTTQYGAPNDLTYCIDAFEKNDI